MEQEFTYLCDTCVYKISDLYASMCSCKLKGDEVFKVIASEKYPPRERCHWYCETNGDSDGNA